MVIYPIAYIALSLPLAAARMADARDQEWSSTYHGIAGCFMACSGWVDVLLYALTRKSLVLASHESAKGESSAYNRRSTMKKHPWSMIHDNHNTTSINTNSKMMHAKSVSTLSADFDERHGRHAAHKHKDYELGRLGDVVTQTTIEIRSEPAPEVGYGGQSYQPIKSLK
ncbi:hypothetical protein KEM54_001389 [Ascosphaera aggregata]|nr:hypothetical protein KEM54_001389 [Ascosphaera aggregata]